MQVPQKTLYDQVVDITYNYLGPAADRFVSRQIRNHLQKDPQNLGQSDLDKLIDWIRLAVSLLSPDPAVVDRYISDLQGLVSRKKVGRKNGKIRTA